MFAHTVAGAGTDALHRLIDNPPTNDASAEEWSEWLDACAWAATPKSCSGGGCQQQRHGGPGCGQNNRRGYLLAHMAMPAALRAHLQQAINGGRR